MRAVEGPRLCAKALETGTLRLIYVGSSNAVKRMGSHNPWHPVGVPQLFGLSAPPQHDGQAAHLVKSNMRMPADVKPKEDTTRKKTIAKHTHAPNAMR